MSDSLGTGQEAVTSDLCFKRQIAYPTPRCREGILNIGIMWSKEQRVVLSWYVWKTIRAEGTCQERLKNLAGGCLIH